MTETKPNETNVPENGETISCDVFYEFDDIAINCDELPETQPPANGGPRVAIIDQTIQENLS